VYCTSGSGAETTPHRVSSAGPSLYREPGYTVASAALASPALRSGSESRGTFESHWPGLILYNGWRKEGQMITESAKPRLKFVLAFATAFLGVGVVALSAVPPTTHHQVIVPGEDRFKPFSLTIRVGDSVEWINNDTDDHTVVSNDFFNTTGDKNVNTLLPGTDSNGGVPGTFTMRFTKPGVFNFYCRIHSKLDDEHQPTAPGPGGGIQDPTTGNYGTPMMGVITVLSGQGDQGQQQGQ
jgi:plastocyanin